jgi:hypothetical protein
MSNSREWHSPTQKLLNWAAELGVEVPEGISGESLYGLLRSTDSKRTHARMKVLNLQPGVRFRRKNDGVTYTLRGNYLGGKVRAYNEKAKMMVEISGKSFLMFYELIE